MQPAGGGQINQAIGARSDLLLLNIEAASLQVHPLLGHRMIAVVGENAEREAQGTQPGHEVKAAWNGFTDEEEDAIHIQNQGIQPGVVRVEPCVEGRQDVHDRQAGRT